MKSQDIVQNFRNQFNNVARDDEQLNSIMLDVFMDIQKQTNIFKLLVKLDFTPPSVDSNGNNIDGLYNYNLKQVLSLTSGFKTSTDIGNVNVKDVINKEQLIIPSFTKNEFTFNAIPNNIIGVYTKDFGPLPNSIIKADYLLLDQDNFDFKDIPFCYVYGSVMIYDFNYVSEHQFVTIKDALYWGTLDKLHVSVSNPNNAQMENVYYQRYYNAVKNIINNSSNIIGLDDFNDKIANFV